MCFSDCGNVPFVTNGKYVLDDGNSTTFGSVATVTCDTGYESVHKIITCLENGQWSDTLCTAKGVSNANVLYFNMCLMCTIYCCSNSILSLSETLVMFYSLFFCK